MKAVVNGSSGIEVVDTPEPEGDGVVLDIVSSSICGTDLNFVAMGASGFVYGHEFAGLVDGVAYAVEPTLHCRRCAQCVAGHTQRCTESASNMGIFIDGGLCERQIVPEYTLVRLPDTLAVEDACLVETGSVAMHGVRRAEIVPGERVVVVGGGSIGLMAVACVRHLGHEVDLEARHLAQIAAGERLGAGRPKGGYDSGRPEGGYDTGRPEGGYDVVIEATGTASGVARCAELANPGARVILLGVFHDTVPLPGITTLVKELSFTGAMAYGSVGGVRETELVAQMLGARPEIAQAVITHRFDLADAVEAFRVAGDREAGAIKVVLHP